jgi:hypothetical protein
MPTTIKTFRPYRGAGNVYARVAGSTDAMVELGNVGELKLAHEEDVQSLADNRPGGGTYAESRQLKAVTLTAAVYDWNRQNLSWLLRGSASTVASGTVTDEPHTAKTGGLIRLAHINPTSVVVTSDPAGTIFVAGTDYEVRPEGLMILASGNITDDAAILVSYANPEYDVIEALTGSGVELELVFGGMNEADSNGDSPQILDVWKFKPAIAKELGLISSGFGSLPLEGTVLKDGSKTGSGISKFYRISQQ